MPAASSLAGDTVSRPDSYKLASWQENLVLTGTNAANGTGNGGANVIIGNNAANVLSGNGGDDRLYGAGGNDEFFGGSGNDRIFGGDGNDRIRGDDGQDTLHGGAGADRFILAKASQSPAGQGRDVILDFSSAQGDRIDLSRIDANAKAPGNKAFTFIGADAFTGTAGQLHAVVKDGLLLVEGDVNGDRTADFQIEVHGGLGVQGVPTLHASDFVL
jgi:Ca2+-binding RTX toxin-like protein